MKNAKTADPHGFNNCFSKGLKFISAWSLSIVYAHIFSVGKYRVPGALLISPQFLNMVFHQMCRIIDQFFDVGFFCKIFERILKQQMLTRLLENHLIIRQQFGFLSKCSTCTQLLDSVNDWTLTVCDRRSVDVIYFDFAKAFDSVSHRKLVNKLEAYGICGNMLNVRTDFFI